MVTNTQLVETKDRNLMGVLNPIIDYFDYMQSWFERRGFTTAFLLPESAITCLMRRLSKRQQKRFEALICQYQSTFNQLKHEKSRTDEAYNLLLKQVADIKLFLRLK
ncbi:hypothetical protein [Arsenophonus endosymbiont of Aleurodicus floccissimus]|uniref:hypothetical protein n=1 Tax=Arsenophonus endosymbiont of Aleurodicus floccissimus TaxID=2152761 RepID=UPI0011C3EC23|nr:hypothetical protein [Arsenophonus endosymbiont of Aleurodicus floccissimus]